MPYRLRSTLFYNSEGIGQSPSLLLLPYLELWTNLCSTVSLIYLLTMLGTRQPNVNIGFTRLVWCRIINRVLPTFIQTGVFAVLSLTCQHIHNQAVCNLYKGLEPSPFNHMFFKTLNQRFNK